MSQSTLSAQNYGRGDVDAQKGDPYFRLASAEGRVVSNYLFIESRGAFESATAPAFLSLARDLAQQGSKVEIFLVQNGVMPARAGAKTDGLSAAIQSGIAVLADEFSLKERALSGEQLMKGVRPAAIGTVIDRMAAGWKIVWH